MNFIEQMKQKARADRQRIVLPEATDLRVLQAASTALREKIADIILIGNKEEILRTAGDLDVRE